MTQQLEKLYQKVIAGNHLQRSEAGDAATCLAAETVDAAAKEAFLQALACKGETAEEVAGFAKMFAGLARDPGTQAFAGGAIDIVGTGGDHSGTFNISSTTAFYAAAAGIPVIKHGNRSITSKCGSAQLIEAVGFDLEPDSSTITQSLKQLNFAFLFAPHFHPAFKTIMPVRQALAAKGQRTIFNILGPLINPGKPAFNLLGVFSQKWVAPYAAAAHALGLKRGLVVHCALGPDTGMDELSTAGVNHVAGFGQLSGYSAEWRAADLGLQTCHIDDLKGGDVQTNRQILLRLSEGSAPPGLQSSLALNLAAALWVASRAESIESGLKQANEIIASECLSDWLKQVHAFKP